MPFEHALHLGERTLGDAWDVVGFDERNLRHRSASMVSAQRSSGSSECTFVLPHAREHLHLEHQRVQEVVDAPAAWSTMTAFTAGSCVVIPTGQRPVWQW
jgi:hypothetical protein